MSILLILPLPCGIGITLVKYQEIDPVNLSRGDCSLPFYLGSDITYWSYFDLAIARVEF